MEETSSMVLSSRKHMRLANQSNKGCLQKSNLAHETATCARLRALSSSTFHITWTEIAGIISSWKNLSSANAERHLANSSPENSWLRPAISVPMPLITFLSRWFATARAQQSFVRLEAENFDQQALESSLQISTRTSVLISLALAAASAAPAKALGLYEWSSLAWCVSSKWVAMRSSAFSMPFVISCPSNSSNIYCPDMAKKHTTLHIYTWNLVPRSL